MSGHGPPVVRQPTGAGQTAHRIGPPSGSPAEAGTGPVVVGPWHGGRFGDASAGAGGSGPTHR
ncbi:hypothetical protein EF879_17850 [Micromonospora sp. HM5-17]|nr:hypothetical protein EF879_17850 [Micromonospora sp. HM5-17]